MVEPKKLKKKKLQRKKKEKKVGKKVLSFNKYSAV